MRTEIIAASDTHGSTDLLQQLELAYPRAEFLIHCGDLEDETYKIPNWLIVKGNNDWNLQVPSQRIISVGQGISIFVCHSHQFGYYKREEKIAAKAKEYGCQIALFGHTHCGLIEEVNGVLLVNPGSMAWPRDGKEPSYARIVIEDGKIHAELIYRSQWPFQEKKKKWYWR